MFLGGLQSKPKGPKQHVCECEVEFTGLISRSTCCTVAIELIKYVLVQRDQIPETFDSLLTHDNNQQQQVQHQQYIDQNELQKKESSSLSYGTVSHPSVSSTGRMDSDMEDDRLKPKIHSFHKKKVGCLTEG